MNFNNWIERHRDKFGSKYEILFATQVLPLVEGLQCDAVTSQHPFVDSDGKNRYSDFTIVESEAVSIAIEIDGYDKQGTGKGMSYENFLDWQRRQASLASQGWHVLRFANRDVRDEPRRCAEHISRLLNRLRQAQTGRVEIITIQCKPPEVIVVSTKVKDVELSEAATKKIHKFLPLVALSLLGTFAFWHSNSGKPVDRTVFQTVVTPVVPGNLLPPRYVSTETIPSDAFPSRASTLASSIVPVTPVDNNPGSEEFFYGTMNCRNPLDWSFAKKYIGQVVTVIGPLFATKSRPNVTGGPMWLDVGGRYPSQDRLTVVVWGKNWSKFDTQKLDAKYWFETISDEMSYASICITGKVSEYKGIPQIELQDPGQIKIALSPN